MSLLRRPFSSLWIVVPICALALIYWFNRVRVQRIETLSSLAGGEALVVDAKSPTGYAAGLRQLLLPERDGTSYQWVLQTQQMQAEQTWHLRRTTYDNAPIGRPVTSASAYRWWLGAVAAVDRALFGHSSGIALENAAKWADPALHGLLLIALTCLVAWLFNRWAAAAVALALVGLFPLSGNFAAGLPDDRGLGLGLMLTSLLLFLGAAHTAAAWTKRCFFLAGLAGACALWIDPAASWPMLLGLTVAGVAVSYLSRAPTAVLPVEPQAWRQWALGGAVGCLATYLAEFAPDELGSLNLTTVHPLWGVAWLGLAELAARLAIRRRDGRFSRPAVDFAFLGLAALALASVPVVAALGKTGFPTTGGLSGSILTRLQGGLAAPNLGAWLAHPGSNTALLATLAPLLFLVPLVGLAFSRTIAPQQRALFVLALGPVAVALGYAVFQLRWWAQLDVALVAVLALLVGTAPLHFSKVLRWVASVALLVSLGFGLAQLAPEARTRADDLAESEVEALVERDLAYWLANRVGPTGTVVLAPPAMTPSLIFHGGLRGLATPDPKNQDGFSAAVRIASASSPDEARALMEKRGVTHVVIPSWDTFMDEFARLGGSAPENTLVGLLHRWLPPRWMRPVSYQLPKVAGFEGQSVVVFESVELQDNLSALARLAEYFSEMGRLDEAVAAAKALASLYSDEPDALLARAQVAMATGERTELLDCAKNLEARVSEGADQLLPWDRRLSLVVVLADAKKYELAREQLKRCLQEVDETKLRTLSTVGLFRLQMLCRGFHEQIGDPGLRELARKLLPPDMRDA